MATNKGSADYIATPGGMLASSRSENRVVAFLRTWGSPIGGLTLFGSAIVAVVSFVVGTFFETPYLREVEQQINEVERRLEDRIEGLENAIDDRINALDSASDERMDGISIQLEGVRAQLELIVADLRAERSGGENDAD